MHIKIIASLSVVTAKALAGCATQTESMLKQGYTLADYPDAAEGSVDRPGTSG